MMRDEAPKKEILTKEKCKLDLLESIREPVLPLVLALVLLALTCAIMDGMLLLLGSGIGDMPAWALPVMMATVWMIPAFAGIWILRGWRKGEKQKRRIQKGEFRIVRDRLERAVMDADYKIPTRYDNGQRDLLVFAEYGNCYLTRFIHYKWSKLYSMSARGVYNTAIAGDCFYLVIYDGENTPAVVYNAKMFEMEEEEQW